jgi:hypothetical protein
LRERGGSLLLAREEACEEKRERMSEVLVREIGRKKR